MERGLVYPNKKVLINGLAIPKKVPKCISQKAMKAEQRKQAEVAAKAPSAASAPGQ